MKRGVEQTGAPSPEFIEKVQGELDEFQQGLLSEALKMYPEEGQPQSGSDTPIGTYDTDKQAELHRKLEMYTLAAEKGVEVPNKLSSVRPSNRPTDRMQHVWERVWNQLF